MSVSRMQKMQLLAHNSVKEPLKSYLREAGVLEITDVTVEGFSSRPSPREAEQLARLAERAEFASSFLERYSPKKSFLAKLSQGPEELDQDTLERYLRELNVEEIAERCEQLEAQMRRTADERAWANDIVRELSHWTNLERPLESYGTERCEVQFWSFPESGFQERTREILERKPLADLVTISVLNGKVYAAAIAMREEAPALTEELKQIHGARFSVENLKGTVLEIIEREKRRIADLERESREAEQIAFRLAAIRPALLALADHFNERRALVDVEKHFLRTDRTVLIEGWIRAVDRNWIKREISKRWGEVEVDFREPLEGEDPPVALENGPRVRPFEFVLTLYGRPLYGEIDPTPLFAPFFVLCFAICLGDAGYGAVLSILSSLMLFKLKVRGGMRSLFQLLLLGGILTIPVGILTGGYFGVEIGRIPGFLQSLVILDPLNEPMKMLNVAFAIGIVHILFGMGIKAAIHFRAGLWMDAIFDDICWMILIAALVPLGYVGILGGTVPRAILGYAARVALAAATVIFLTGMRKERNRVLGTLKSLLRFYSITSYLGDVLSYARLLALGLATGAIAIAINGIAGMASGLPAFMGYVAATLILLLGHTFNLSVNILGAFVHSARLQYLEFFNKFFTGGGREFLPFRSERRYTILRSNLSR